MAKVKIGFIGAGNMGQSAHLKNFAALPDCAVVALAEIRTGLARRVAQKFDVPRVYATHTDMLAREQVDGIVAIQPFTHHGQLLPDVYRSGVPVLTEKPLGSSLGVGERLLAALRAGGSWHMVGYHKRSDPATAYARSMIDAWRESGEAGRMRYVRITMPPGDWIAGGFDDLVRTDEPYPDLPADPAPGDMDAEAFADYVSFVNYYIHQVNLLRFLLGEPYRVTHAVRSGTLFVAESAGGATGVIEMAPYHTTVEWCESALIGFERGCIRLHLPAPLAASRPGHVEVLLDPGHGAIPQSTSPHLPWVSAMRQQAANFVRAIRGEAVPPCQAAEALEDLRVARDYLRLWKGA
jgi:predicted dehydrogenase